MSANYNVRPSDRVVVAATIDPSAQSASTVTSDWVDMAQFDSIEAIIFAGTLGSSATLDAALYQAQDGSGTNGKVFSPAKSITQLTQAGTDANKQAIINCYSYELDRANNFTHVAVKITVATAASGSAAVILGHDAKYQPAAQLTSVDSVI